ncbi:hypothetical protein [Endozoicomonas sp. ALB115]|uniref:hypothetical protein n=1 Tax=Endozoicomonas sp. ALB115 TaxID=3403074 RepID=UPI003BB703BD
MKINLFPSADPNDTNIIAIPGTKNTQMWEDWFNDNIIESYGDEGYPVIEYEGQKLAFIEGTTFVTGMIVCAFKRVVDDDLFPWDSHSVELFKKEMEGREAVRTAVYGVVKDQIANNDYESAFAAVILNPEMMSCEYPLSIMKLLDESQLESKKAFSEKISFEEFENLAYRDLSKAIIKESITRHRDELIAENPTPLTFYKWMDNNKDYEWDEVLLECRYGELTEPSYIGATDNMTDFEVVQNMMKFAMTDEERKQVDQ